MHRCCHKRLDRLCCACGFSLEIFIENAERGMSMQVDEEKFPSLPGGPPPTPPRAPSATPPGPQQDPSQPSSSRPASANPKLPFEFALWGDTKQDQGKSLEQHQAGRDQSDPHQNGWGASLHKQNGWEQDPSDAQADWQNPKHVGHQYPSQDQHQPWAQPEPPSQDTWNKPQQQGWEQPHQQARWEQPQHSGGWDQPQQQDDWEQPQRQGKWEQDQGHWGQPSHDPHQDRHQALNQDGWDLRKQDSGAGPVQGMWEPSAHHRADSHRYTSSSQSTLNRHGSRSENKSKVHAVGPRDKSRCTQMQRLLINQPAQQLVIDCAEGMGCSILYARCCSVSPQAPVPPLLLLVLLLYMPSLRLSCMMME